MPRLTGETDAHQIGGGNFTFTGARIANLGASEYTLVDIEVDMSTSVGPFRDELIAMIGTVLDACGKSPRSDNLLIRLGAFASRFKGGLQEVHGFLPLAEIDRAKYDSLRTGGGTPLFDACYIGAGAVNAYAKMLFDQDFPVNAITFVITDGDNNDSTATEDMIKDEIEKATKSECLESHVSVLIGVNVASYRAILEQFQRSVGITQFIDAGDATKAKLAKLAQFVSQSISSTSQALGTGGPSQNIAAAI